jgi:hypothetical protein
MHYSGALLRRDSNQKTTARLSLAQSGVCRTTVEVIAAPLHSSLPKHRLCLCGSLEAWNESKHEEYTMFGYRQGPVLFTACWGNCWPSGPSGCTCNTFRWTCLDPHQSGRPRPRPALRQPLPKIDTPFHHIAVDHSFLNPDRIDQILCSAPYKPCRISEEHVESSRRILLHRSTPSCPPALITSFSLFCCVSQ